MPILFLFTLAHQVIIRIYHILSPPPIQRWRQSQKDEEICLNTHNQPTAVFYVVVHFSLGFGLLYCICPLNPSLSPRDCELPQNKTGFPPRAFSTHRAQLKWVCRFLTCVGGWKDSGTSTLQVSQFLSQHLPFTSSESLWQAEINTTENNDQPSSKVYCIPETIVLHIYFIYHHQFWNICYHPFIISCCFMILGVELGVFTC